VQYICIIGYVPYTYFNFFFTARKRTIRFLHWSCWNCRHSFR
jgi:hypothetical protein